MRKTHRSNKGPKLYPLGSVKSRLRDIEAYKRDGPCRHHRTWLIAGGNFEWCYVCGALRGMMMITPTTLTNRTKWQRPVGAGGENPSPLKVLPGKEKS